MSYYFIIMFFCLFYYFYAVHEMLLHADSGGREGSFKKVFIALFFSFCLLLLSENFENKALTSQQIKKEESSK